MRHAKKGRALGTDASHTKAILRSLARALFISERIKTTEARAKEVRGLVDKIITWGKRGDVHARRLAMGELGDKALVHKIFADIAPRFAEREGGYTRIMKLGPRKGDAAPMVILELVE
jgi:large subunit ribosomal protein L17